MMGSWYGQLGLVGVALMTTYCQRVDVYAVTSERVVEAGATSTEPTQSEPTQSEPTQSEPTQSEPTVTAPESSSTTESVCAAFESTPGDSSVTITVGSLTRSYVLHIPATYDASVPVPLVIDFHGAGGSGWDQLMTSPYPAVTDPSGAVMVFPDGVNGPIGNAWNIGPCCVPGVDDLAFVDALLADVQERVCVDSSRVYAVGVLTGGGLVHHLACERSQVFAAVSPAAFDLIEETVDTCIPAESITVVAFRGTADGKVPYEGGSSSLVPDMPVTFLGAVGSFERWASINGCVGDPSAPDSNGCSAYTQCTDGVEVVLCTEEGGRGEPGDATIAWEILERHVRTK